MDKLGHFSVQFYTKYAVLNEFVHVCAAKNVDCAYLANI